MKKSKLFIVGMVISIIGALGCIGVVINGTYNTIVGCLIVIVTGAILIVVDTLKNNHSVNKEQDSVKKTKETSQFNQKIEVGKSHVKVFKVAGVTFNERQKNLKKLLNEKMSGKRLNISMNQYSYEGKPAISLTVNGLDIGNLHTEDTEFILTNPESVLGFKDIYIDKFENEECKIVYYAKIKLIFKNKQQK